jgi:hypothetical protein
LPRAAALGLDCCLGPSQGGIAARPLFRCTGRRRYTRTSVGSAHPSRASYVCGTCRSGCRRTPLRAPRTGSPRSALCCFGIGNCRLCTTARLRRCESLGCERSARRRVRVASCPTSGGVGDRGVVDDGEGSCAREREAAHERSGRDRGGGADRRGGECQRERPGHTRGTPSAAISSAPSSPRRRSRASEVRRRSACGPTAGSRARRGGSARYLDRLDPRLRAS